MNRRELLKQGATMALALSPLSALSAESIPPKSIREKPLPSKRPQGGVRIVVVGGGWSGLAFAEHIRRYLPQSVVTLVEKRESFLSCPVSNAWLFDLVDLEFLSHSYLDGANTHGYTYLHAEATDLDSRHHILKTTKGEIGYDYLLFATGIEYDYDVWCRNNPTLEHRLRTEYPAGFIAGSEHLTLKRKIANYHGGNFFITIPRGNYRCLPAPYERACLLADYIKQNKIKGRVIILDANNRVTIKEEGFLRVFKERYSKELLYISSAEIVSIDLDRKVIETEFEEVEFVDGSFYPNVRAPKLLERLGLTTQTPYNRIEANLDVYTNRFKGHDTIFGCGDLRPMGFSKSGNTAYTEGANVAKIVAKAIAKKPLKWVSPTTFCVSLVSSMPQQEMTLLSEYTYGERGETQFKYTSSDEAWDRNGLGKAHAQFSWAGSMYDRMFYL